MKIIDFFKNKTNSFSFEIETIDFNTPTIDDNTKKTIMLWHKILKKNIDKHISFLKKYYPKEIKKENSWIKKSCMELSAIYYYYFVQDFSENKISTEIGQNYLAPIFNNFQTLESEIQFNGFKDLSDFFNKKAGYFHEVLNNDQNLSTYLSSIFIYAPLKDIHPYTPTFTELDVTKILVLEKYCSELVQTISRESLDFVKRIKQSPFSFEIEFETDTTLEFDIKIDNKTKRIIKEEQRKLKDRIDWHIKFISSHYSKEMSKDNQMIQKACLEFSVMYFYYFVHTFSKAKIPREICQYYLLPLEHNFNDLYPELKDKGFNSLKEFFKIKTHYFHKAINFRKSIPLGYFYNIFVVMPLSNIDPSKYSFTRTELYKKDAKEISSMLGEFDFYFAKLRSGILKESTECAARLTKTKNNS